MTDPAGVPPDHPGHRWPRSGPPGGYPPPQPYPGSYPPPPGPPRNGLGSAALVVAVAAVLTVLSVVGGVVLGGIAVLLGLLGYRRANRGVADNGVVAVCGTVLGALAVVAGFGCIFIYVGIWNSVGGDDYLDCMSRAGSDPALQQQCTDRFRDRLENRFAGTTAPVTSTP